MCSEACDANFHIGKGVKMISIQKTEAKARIITIIGLVVSLVVAVNFVYYSKSYAGDPVVSMESIDILSKTNQAMAEVVAAVKPSVVNIASSKIIKGGGALPPFSNNPSLKRFFGEDPGFSEKPKGHRQSALGSGVIVQREGLILTNNHVIKGADEIKVILSDKREFQGRVIGTDPKTDLAVIKIDSDNLPVIGLGDSDKLRAGEIVLAIGNPFGLNQTVTTGIVSATGRANVGIADYEDFIQTDAPINPGNSGGALVNIKGELIGINTAIFSTTGGYQGIGFAIPSNMAKAVMESLIKNGKVVRGWLGVTIQTLTPELSKQFSLKDEKGVLVADVTEDSPADKAGIQRGDIIVEFSAKEVEDGRNLRNMVAGTVPNTQVKVKLIRDGNPKTVEVMISELPAETQMVAKTFDTLLKGVHVQNIPPALMRDLGISKRIAGVVITDIEEGGPAEGVLMKDDIIMEINKNRVSNTKDYESVALKIKSEQNMLLLIFRKDAAFYVTLAAK
jgi:serine protease Do